MNKLTTLEQMLRLLPHWAEHLQSHVDELTDWRKQSQQTLEPAALKHLLEAEDKMDEACVALLAAFSVISEDSQTENKS